MAASHMLTTEEFGRLVEHDTPFYTVSQKNDTDVAGYIFNAHQPILIVFGR